jgi:hypothetical protein
LFLFKQIHSSLGTLSAIECLGSAYNNQLSVSCVVDLNTSEYFSCQYYQNSGSSLTDIVKMSFTII